MVEVYVGFDTRRICEHCGCVWAGGSGPVLCPSPKSSGAHRWGPADLGFEFLIDPWNPWKKRP